MTQSRHDKTAAIASLLSLIFLHLDELPHALKTARQEWVSEPSSLDEPKPTLVAYELGCRGTCATCLASYAATGKRPVCPPEEAWVRMRDHVRRRYRVGDVYDSLLRLRDYDVGMAQAVWAVYVEPWPDPKTEPIGAAAKLYRDELAALGLDWMADDVEGDVPAFGEDIDPTDNEIRRMLADGITERRIARELRVGRERIRSLKRAETVRCG